jgi:hypothetical protein
MPLKNHVATTHQKVFGCLAWWTKPMPRVGAFPVDVEIPATIKKMAPATNKPYGS